MTFREFKNKFTLDDEKSDTKETLLKENKSPVLCASNNQNSLEIKFKPKLLKSTTKQPLGAVSQNITQLDSRPLRNTRVKTNYEPMSSPAIRKKEKLHSVSVIALPEVSIS